jgi:hypothetical protein
MRDCMCVLYRPTHDYQDVKQRWSGIKCVAKIYFELFRASEGTLNRCSQRHLQSLAPTNLHCARVVGYVYACSHCVIHKESLYPRSVESNRLLMNYPITIQCPILYCKCMEWHVFDRTYFLSQFHP